jgi:hypothetical protein
MTPLTPAPDAAFTGSDHRWDGRARSTTPPHEPHVSAGRLTATSSLLINWTAAKLAPVHTTTPHTAPASSTNRRDRCKRYACAVAVRVTQLLLRTVKSAQRFSQ